MNKTELGSINAQKITSVALAASSNIVYVAATQENGDITITDIPGNKLGTTTQIGTQSDIVAVAATETGKVAILAKKYAHSKSSTSCKLCL
jgi:ribosomal protein S11